MDIKLSEINFVPLKPRNGWIGCLSFVLNDCFYIGGISVYSRPNGSIRLLYPTKKLKSGKNLPIFHPINREASDAIEKAVDMEITEVFEGVKDDGQRL